MTMISIQDEMKDGRTVLLSTRNVNMFSPWTGIPRKAQWVNGNWHDIETKEVIAQVRIIGAMLEDELAHE